MIFQVMKSRFIREHDENLQEEILWKN
jgi:hypothetical protein